MKKKLKYFLVLICNMGHVTVGISDLSLCSSNKTLLYIRQALL